MNDDEKIIEVSFTDVKDEEVKPIYHTTSQVATILGETDSTIRIWCDKFIRILKVETSGRNRAFTQENIDKLKIIKTLIRDKGFSHKQIIEHFDKKEEDLLNEIAVSEKNPLAVQMIAVALAKEVNDNVNNTIKELMVQFVEREDQIQRQNQQQIEELKSTIEKLTEKIDNQYKTLDEKELQAKNRDLEIIELLKARQEERKSQQHVSLLSKLFGKK